MGKFDDIVAKLMAVTDHKLSWVDVYVACLRSTVYDTPFSIFQDVRKPDNFTMIKKKHNELKNMIWWV